MRKLIYFHASWCGPCKVYNREFIVPLEQLVGTEYIERIDAWKEPYEAKKYDVDRLPTIVLLNGNAVYMNRTGAIDIDKVAKWLRGECDAI